MLARWEHLMSYSWLIYGGFAAAYTWIVFRGPFGDDFPLIWSSQNLMPREWIVLIHSLFLAAYLGVLWYLSWRDSSFNWLTRGSIPGALYMFFAAAFTGVIERLLLYRGPERVQVKDEYDSKNDSQRVPGE
jgi:hypothetical protein